MAISWASEEFETVDLGDRRLNKRLKMLAETLGDKPGASIPAACEGWAETAAAYRLLANEKVGWRDVLEAHGRATVQRMSAESVVLCLQDTTELDYQGRAMRGLGAVELRGSARPVHASDVRGVGPA